MFFLIYGIIGFIVAALFFSANEKDYAELPLGFLSLFLGAIWPLTLAAVAVGVAGSFLREWLG